MSHWRIKPPVTRYPNPIPIRNKKPNAYSSPPFPNIRFSDNQFRTHGNQ